MGNLELEPSVSMNWDTDAKNPRNWSPARMAVSTAVVSGIGFVRYVRIFWRFTGRPLMEVSHPPLHLKPGWTVLGSFMRTGLMRTSQY
jgi:hypothetical protein